MVEKQERCFGRKGIHSTTAKIQEGLENNALGVMHKANKHRLNESMNY